MNEGRDRINGIYPWSEPWDSWSLDTNAGRQAGYLHGLNLGISRQQLNLQASGYDRPQLYIVLHIMEGLIPIIHPHILTLVLNQQLPFLFIQKYKVHIMKMSPDRTQHNTYHLEQGLIQ